MTDTRPDWKEIDGRQRRYLNGSYYDIERRGNSMVTFSPELPLDEIETEKGCWPGCLMSIAWTLFCVFATEPSKALFNAVGLTVISGKTRAPDWMNSNGGVAFLFVVIFGFPFYMTFIGIWIFNLCRAIRNQSSRGEVIEVETLEQCAARNAAAEKNKRALEQRHDAERRAAAAAKAAEDKRAADQKTREAETLLARLAREAKEAAAARASRLARCTIDTLRPHAFEPFVFDLPEQWRPFTMVGVAKANVAAYSQLPADQRFNQRDQRWETVGMAGSQARGVYLVGLGRSSSLSKPAVVGPSFLKGTTSEDTLAFIVADGEPAIIANHARQEVYEKLPEPSKTFDAAELDIKLERLKPFMVELYRHAIFEDDSSSSGGEWT